MSLWTRSENTFLNNVSLSVSMVFCVSDTVLTTISCFVNSLVKSFIVFFMSPPRAPIITGKKVIEYRGLLSLTSKASCRYRVSLLFVSIFYCMGHAMSQIQICFSYFVLSIKSGLLAVSVFFRLNWKSQTSFALSFFKTIPRFHRSLYHTVSAPINLCFFAQVTASIISALLSFVKYSLLDKTMHPATRCSTVSLCPWHTRHWPSSISPRVAFQDLVSTICSSIDMIDDVFRR